MILEPAACHNYFTMFLDFSLIFTLNVMILSNILKHMQHIIMHTDPILNVSYTIYAYTWCHEFPETSNSFIFHIQQMSSLNYTVIISNYLIIIHRNNTSLFIRYHDHVVFAAGPENTQALWNFSVWLWTHLKRTLARSKSTRSFDEVVGGLEHTPVWGIFMNIPPSCFGWKASLLYIANLVKVYTGGFATGIDPGMKPIDLQKIWRW